MPKLPTRCKKYSVGKEIGGAVYVHRMYEGCLPPPVKFASAHLPKDFDYTVIKFVQKELSVSFAFCPDFDSADEPTVGDIVRVDESGLTKYFRQQADPFIYHHKWLFVMDDYKGFDIQMSRSRSISWIGLGGIDVKLIGRKGYWTSHVVPKLPKHPIRWHSTDEAVKALKISGCELSHWRQTGKLKFTKIGNSYYYSI